MLGRKLFSFPSGTCRSWAGLVGLDDSLVWGVVGGGEGSGSSISPQILFSKTPQTQLLSKPISLVLHGRQLHCKVVSSLLSLTF